MKISQGDRSVHQHQACKATSVFYRFLYYFPKSWSILRDDVWLCSSCKEYIIPPKQYYHPIFMIRYFLTSFSGVLMAMHCATLYQGAMRYCAVLGSVVLSIAVFYFGATALILAIFPWQKWEDLNEDKDISLVHRGHINVLFLYGIIVARWVYISVPLYILLGVLSVCSAVIRIIKKKSLKLDLVAIMYAILSGIFVKSINNDYLSFADTLLSIILLLAVTLEQYSEDVKERI